MTSANNSCAFFGCHLEVFSSFYHPFHLPLTLVICTSGMLANCLNVVVLTRPSMHSPTNAILTALSLAQCMLTANYVFLQAVEYLRHRCHTFPWSATGAYYRLINVNMSIYFHSVAFMHTLLLAMFRVVVIKFPIFANRNLIRPRKVRREAVCAGIVRYPTVTVASGLLWLIVLILCLPVSIFVSEVTKVKNGGSISCSLPEMYDLTWTDDAAVHSAVLWFFGILFKLVPSVVLVAAVTVLVESLESVERRRRSVLLRSSTDIPNNKPSMVTQDNEEHRLLPATSGINSGTSNHSFQRQSLPYLNQVTTDSPQMRAKGASSCYDGSSEMNSSYSTPVPIRAQNRSYSTASTDAQSCSSRVTTLKAKQHKLKPRTTQMLVTVVCLCLVVELPHGALNLMLALYGQEFGSQVYDPLGDLLEMLTLLYSSVNFVLYCCMSSEFRQTFRRLFFCAAVRSVLNKRRLSQSLIDTQL